MTEIHVMGDAVPPIKAVFEQYMNTGGLFIVADEVPEDWQAAPDAKTLITVADDGGPTLWPVWSEPLIRVTVHAYGKQTAKLWRAVALGVLMARVPSGMAIGKTGIGYTDGRDPDTGADMASFTVRATVRTQVITV